MADDTNDGWCDCDAQEKGCGTYFIDDEYDKDGNRTEKHHYRCNACDGITQVG